MTIFEAVKSTVKPRMAAEHYGLSVSRNGMVCCPFHIVGTSSISFALPQATGFIHSTVPPLPTKSSILQEPLSHPSMKLYDAHFHCFGCQANGDVLLRFAKYKGPEIGHIEAHNERTKAKYASNPDVDTSRSQLNFHLVAPERKYRAKVEKQIAEAGCCTRSGSDRAGSQKGCRA